jgi:hypothetical protein
MQYQLIICFEHFMRQKVCDRGYLMQRCNIWNIAVTLPLRTGVALKAEATTNNLT